MFDFDHMDEYTYVHPETNDRRVPAIVISGDSSEAIKVAMRLKSLGYIGCNKIEQDETHQTVHVITVRAIDRLFGVANAIYFATEEWCANHPEDYRLYRMEDVFFKIQDLCLSDIDAVI